MFTATDHLKRLQSCMQLLIHLSYNDKKTELIEHLRQLRTDTTWLINELIDDRIKL